MTCNPRMHMGIKINSHMNTGTTKIPLCLRGSRCNPRMHTGIACNPHMHTGIDLDPRMHTGICAIPVCIRGSDGYGDQYVIPVCIQGFARSPYAFIVVHGADRRHSRRRWRSSLNAAAVDIVGSDGGLRPRRSLSTEAAMGWSQRRRSSLFTVAAKAPSPPQPSTAAAFDNDRHPRR